MRRWLVTMAVAGLMLVGAAPALASGGKGSGGATASGGGGAASGGGAATGGGGGTATGGGASGGGGGASGGGGNHGGQNDPAPAPAPTSPPPPPAQGPPCATFQVATAPVDYFETFAALWHDYVLDDCSPEAEDVDVEIIDADCETGRVDFDSIDLIPLSAGQNQGIVVDNDFAPYSTTYCITYIARDVVSGAEVDRTTLTATTPPPQ